MPRNDDEPRVTIRTMTDYLIATGAHQRFTVIQAMKSRLGQRYFAPYYQTARNAIRTYHSGEPEAIDAAIERLLREQRDSIRPSDRAKIDNNLRVLGNYRDHFAIQAFEHRAERFDPIVINGVRVSVEPTLSGTLSSKRKGLACNVMIDTQADSPTGDEIEYVLELLYRGSGVTHPTAVRGAQYWHPASGSSWYLASSSKRRWRDIEDAAREIALRWPTVEG